MKVAQMKVAVVLFAHSPSLAQHAGEINKLLTHDTPLFSSVELWLFYPDMPPETFPEFHGPVSGMKLIHQPFPHFPEACLHLLEVLMDQHPVDLLLFNSDGLGGELATRLAYRLGGSSCVQVQDIGGTSGGRSSRLEVIKPAYGNHLRARFELASPPYCLSVAKQPFCPAKMTWKGGLNPELILLDPPPCNWVTQAVTIPDQLDTGLMDADLVLVVGQGAGSKETVDSLHKIADTLGAQLGASRPVVMNGWTDMNRLIGASGWVLSPKICIAAGISGTAVFNVGIQSSDFIVAINTDPNAPIFQIADIGIVGDLQAVLGELAQVIQTDRDKKELPKTHGSKGPGSGDKK